MNILNLITKKREQLFEKIISSEGQILEAQLFPLRTRGGKSYLLIEPKMSIQKEGEKINLTVLSLGAYDGEYPIDFAHRRYNQEEVRTVNNDEFIGEQLVVEDASKISYLLRSGVEINLTEVKK